MADEGGPEVPVENETGIFPQMLEYLLAQTVWISADLVSQIDHECVPVDEVGGAGKPIIQVCGH